MRSLASASLDESLRLLLHDAQAALLDLYGPWLDRLILFGSRARGDHRPDSDVDLLVVLDDQRRTLPDELREAEYVEIIVDLLLKHDLLLSVVPVTRSRLAANQEPLFWHVQEEGITLFDMEELIQKLMDQAREHLTDAAFLIEERERVRGSMELVYYAIFYAAEAALLRMGTSVKSHSGLIQQFSLKLIKPGAIERDYVTMLARAFDARQKTTYVFAEDQSLDQVKARYQDATQFVARIERYLSEPDRQADSSP